MERREFFAALGTAAMVASTSQVFAQSGGSSQKVNVALGDVPLDVEKREAGVAG